MQCWVLWSFLDWENVSVQRLQPLFIQRCIQESFFAYDDIYDMAQRETEYYK